VPPGSELDRIAIKVVADPIAEINKIMEQRQLYEDAGEIVLKKKETMYYPLTEEELFLIDEADDVFSDVKPYAKDQLSYLELLAKDEDFEEYGWMKRNNDGKAEFVPTKTQKPIQEFPAGEKEDKDAPIIIWSHPLPGQEFGILHVAGADPYNQDEAETSPSLGTLYIYRRTYDPLGGSFQECFVASYSARTKSISKWREQARLLMEYYDATCLPENEEPGFIRYFDERNIAHMIEDGLTLAKEINPQTRANRVKGLAATTPNIRYGNGLLKDYCMEDIPMGQDPNTKEIIYKKGIIRIKDRWLLKEIIAHKPGMGIKRKPGAAKLTSTRTAKKATNVDRIVAARHALILAKLKDKYHPVATLKEVKLKDKPEKRPVKSPFSTGKTNPFGGMKRNPFR